jgi:DNA-binding CsgD family transcriptional regulator
MTLDQDINIRNKLTEFLAEYLKEIIQYGAEHIGYRYFLNDGRSYGFSTNNLWYLKKDQQFYEAQKGFLESEIEFLTANDARFVTRSLEQKDCYYLRELSSRSMSNSLGIYKFAPDKIEHFFFISLSKDPYHIHNMIKYLSKFEVITEKLAYLIPLAFINLNVEPEPEPEFYCNKSIINKFFLKNQKADLSNLNGKDFNGKNVSLTEREIEVLSLVKCNYTNKMIAKSLNISHRTIEKHITNLKSKFGCSKSQLTLFASKQSYNIPKRAV